MSIDLLLDQTTHDVLIEDGDLQLTETKPQLLRQRMDITFRTFVGEWFSNVFFGGIDRSIVLGKPADKATIDAFFIAKINSFDDVEQLVKYESRFDKVNRDFEVNFVVRTSEGNVSLFITSIPPSNEIEYQVGTSAIEAAECDVPSISGANSLYVLLNEEIPTTIPWTLP